MFFALCLKTSDTPYRNGSASQCCWQPSTLARFMKDKTLLPSLFLLAYTTRLDEMIVHHLRIPASPNSKKVLALGSPLARGCRSVGRSAVCLFVSSLLNPVSPRQHAKDGAARARRDLFPLFLIRLHFLLLFPTAKRKTLTETGPNWLTGA